MITRLPRWCLPLALLVTTASWAAEPPAVVNVGDGTFRVTAKAGHMFTRNTKKLQAEAMAIATEFCAKEGKQLKVVDVAEDKSLLVFGEVSQVTLTFKALAPGDPELAPAAASSAAPPKPMTTDQLGDELAKLDALRKKGLLTDQEFEALKQKLLSRY